MKNSIYSILVSVLSTVVLLISTLSLKAQSPSIVGTIDGDTYTIVYDLEEMKSRWESLLQEGGVTANLTNFRIIYDSESNSYLLLADDSDRLIKVAIELVKSGEGGLVESPEKHTVSCSGCAVGCNPSKGSDDKWKCSPPCSMVDCLKTETVTVDDQNIF